MGRRYIAQFGDQEAVHETFLAYNKQLRPNRSGNLYLQVDLSDRSGSISARLWNANDSVYHSFDDGDFVRIEGKTQIYQGAMQMIASHITRVAPNEVDPADFVPVTPDEIEGLVARLRELTEAMADEELRDLARCFLDDEEFLRKFTHAPAGIKNHHAYTGGLLEHVVNLMEVVTRVVDFYPAIDRDLLLMGAFLHDCGKIDELAWEQGLSYTDLGQLVGHMVIAVGILDQKANQCQERFGRRPDEEKLLRLKHMIVSHHGQYEYGSPKLPMTLEAIALHHLDNLDAKVQSFEQQIRDDPNVDSAWTLFNHSISRKLFKGRGARQGRTTSAPSP